MATLNRDRPNRGAPGTAWNDPKTPGLRLRHLASKSAWYLYYRTKGGTQRNLKLADEQFLTLTAARDRARTILRSVSMGLDPANERAELAARATLQELRDRHIEEHATEKNKPAYRKEQEAKWDKVILPFLKAKSAVADIKDADIARLHHSLRATPYSANRTMALLHKAFNLAEMWGMRPRNSNPVTVQHFKEKKRTRKPHADEAVRLLQELDKMRSELPHFVGLIELLCLTGARLNEIKTAKWEWVHDDGLHLPDSKTGEKIVQLSSHAREVLAAIPRLQHNPYIIVGNLAGQHMVNVAKPWARLMEAAEIKERLVRHDLRRFFASAGLSSGVSLSQVGELLGHMEASTTKRYAFLLTGAAQQAAEATSASVRSIMTGGGRVSKDVQTMKVVRRPIR